MIYFRSLNDIASDYLLMLNWLTNQSVRKWYGYDDFIDLPTLKDIKAKYKKKVLNSEECNPLIIVINEVPVGYIQYYKSREYLNLDSVYGIDLFIGNDDYRGRGYGCKVLKAITREIFEKTDAQKIIIDSDVNNIAAIKCYLNAGFQKLKEADNHLIMVIERE